MAATLKLSNEFEEEVQELHMLLNLPPIIGLPRMSDLLDLAPRECKCCASRQPNKMIVIQYPRLKCNQTHSSAQCHPGCKEPVWSLHPGSPTNVQPITSYIFFSLFTPLFTCKPHHAPPRFKIIVGDQLRHHSELCRTS
ncbi:hypothetical protein SORBI_3004G143801 [Sorghum bicolor]|uniref:Uncharacterized protein n=1 Tax=Sorghum bicolor TaxID=4558 RepID=A0A1Z5RMF7_SORBI|nr:hypothetical protein SORBI_3004G143801 [Sorghum bicolor]